MNFATPMKEFAAVRSPIMKVFLLVSVNNLPSITWRFSKYDNDWSRCFSMADKLFLVSGLLYPLPKGLCELRISKILSIYQEKEKPNLSAFSSMEGLFYTRKEKKKKQNKTHRSVYNCLSSNIAQNNVHRSDWYSQSQASLVLIIRPKFHYYEELSITFL